MSKKAVIIGGIIGLIVVITGIILLLGREEAPILTETENLVTVSRPPELGGWQLVKHPNFNVAFKLPPAWKITVFDNGKGEVSSSFSGEELEATIDVSMEENLVGTTPADVLKGNENSFRVSRDRIEGVGFINRLTSELPEGEGGEAGGDASDSYVLTNQYFVNKKILEISCTLFGTNYRIMIPTCEEIIGSLQFIN